MKRLSIFGTTSRSPRLWPTTPDGGPAASATRRRIPLSVLAHLLAAIDLLLLLAVGLLLAWAAQRMGDTGVTGGRLLAVILAALAASAVLRHWRAYHVARLFLPGAQAGIVTRSLMAGALVLLCCLALQEGGDAPLWTWPACWLVLGGVLVGGGKVPVLRLLAHWRDRGLLARHVALIGATKAACAIAARRREGLAAEIVGFYDDSAVEGAPGVAGLPMLGGSDQLLADAQRGLLDAVILTAPLPGDRDPCARVRDLATEIYVLPDADTTVGLRLTTICGIPVCAIEKGPLSDWQALEKALFDRSVALMLILALLPLLLLIATLIKLDSRGSVLFRQSRIGFNNMPFMCFKFRTMYSHMSDALADVQTVRGDPRVTPVGRWLRRLSIDELPQLFNVLLGDMSLVGPRPHAPNTKAAGRLFDEVVAEYARRHRMKPGITGWAQINGWRGETAMVEQIEQRVKYDLYYIASWSLLFDVRILLLTLVRGISGPQAY